MEKVFIKFLKVENGHMGVLVFKHVFLTRLRVRHREARFIDDGKVDDDDKGQVFEKVMKLTEGRRRRRR